MNNDLQYDATLGGTEELPPRLNMLRFTSARVQEIKAMKRAIQTSSGTKLAFQRLPKHMRRRVMSHNAKRLPRRLREIHLNQLKKSGMPPKQKRPSRKYRRRPRNLLDDYARRQRKHVWLETHIWHAKRFHMIEKWGYKLADKPCDKAFRSCYRATSKHCLVQDVSYFTCVEISGPPETLINGFKTISESSSGLSVGAKAYIRGNREGQLVMFQNSNNTKKTIGTIYFHWKPLAEDNNASKRVLWVWIHAAYYSEVLDVITNCFNLQVSDKIGTFFNAVLDLQLIELKNSFNRLRLTGPLSTAVLQNVLRTVTVTDENSEWFKRYVTDSKSLEDFLKQCDCWKSIKNVSSPTELSPGIILSLIVSDPRFHAPKTKTKSMMEGDSTPSNIIIPENSSSGPIWNADIIRCVKENKICNAKIAKLRSQLLVPGTELEEAGEAVPVLLIQQPGNRNRNLGYSSGWDLIVPSGWGNTFWLSLIMWGGRPGGLREFDSMRFESGQMPFLAPDTKAGMQEEQKITELYTQKFFNLPPNKRPNYTKLGIFEPFNYNWKTLVSEWHASSVNDFFVLRDKKSLTTIQEFLLNKKKNGEKLNLDYDMNCIVPVRIKLEQKGSAKRFARIFLPQPSDLKPNISLREPLAIDKNQEIRKEMRNTHRSLLQKLRRQRIKAKKQGKVLLRDVEVITKYSEQMRKLWLPDLSQAIRTSCSRQIMGFVTTGDFSFTQAHSCAVGYVAMGAIKALASNPQRNRVLLRNITSRQYRLATLEVVL